MGGDRILTSQIKNNYGKNVLLKGYVDRIRKLGGINFVILRDRAGTVQIVSETSESHLANLNHYDIVTLEGVVREEPRAPGGCEIVAKKISILSSPLESYPISINPRNKERLETLLEYRPLSLRNPNIREIFVLQQSIAQAFRDYLISQDFVEIFTPKIVPQVAESGSNMFHLKYFEYDAFLTQSPQFYKQIMVGSGLERVFEIGPVFRAEDHNTTRHLNEYVSMDLEMGFIDSYHDLMDIEEDMLRYIFGVISQKHSETLEKYGKRIPQFNKIPRIPLFEMKNILEKEYGKKFEKGKDIDPEGEKLANRYAKENYGSDLIFLIQYPKRIRPFYTFKNKENPDLTDSFDLILNGLEITTGGQRIHDYSELISNMKEFGINPKNCEGYLMAFKYGMPLHGGMGIGLERFTMQLLGLKNIREASLFPRDRTRYYP